MIYTDQGTKVPWDWCPLAFANGIEWGAQGHRYERLYNPLYRWTAPICWTMYLLGFIIGLFYNPKWTGKPKHRLLGGPMTRVAPLLAVLLIAFPCFAQTPAPKYIGPKSGDNEFVVQGKVTKDDASGHYLYDASIGYGWYVSDRNETGVLATFASTSDKSGTGGGAFYDFSPWRSRTGTVEVFVGGDVQAFAGGLNDLATWQGTSRLGVKLHRGSATLRLALEAKKPYSTTSDPALQDSVAQLRQVNFVIGISLLSR